MKSRFKKILSAMLVAATAKVAANPTVTDFQSTKLNLLDNDGNKISVKDKPNLLQKYVLKFGSDNSYLIAGHRSHRSHSSHRSHRSSSSGSYYTPSRGSGSSSSSSSSSSSKSNSSSSNSSSSSSTTAKPLSSSENEQKTTATTIKPATSRICNLGDRTISAGVCGTDVKVLATLLVKHGYLAETDIETDSQGYVFCNAAMVTAIKKFQKDAGLTADGYAGAATIKALKNWKKDE